jgi:hypothetical protein
MRNFHEGLLHCSHPKGLSWNKLRGNTYISPENPVKTVTDTKVDSAL